MRFPNMTAPPESDRLLRIERRAHAFAREQGVSRPVYVFVRALASAILRGWFRVRAAGLDHIPAEGPVIVAPNHKNFLDPFFIGIAIPRRVRYMTKIELFKGPLAWLFPRLGAFPVRRGASDEESLDTARAILRQGGLVVVFPEGTRVEDPDALGSPRHGAGRLALEEGAPIVPAAIVGTSHLWRGALPRLRAVRLAFLPPVVPEAPVAGEDQVPAGAGGDAVSALIDERVWPAVQEEYGRLAGRSGWIAALAAAGIGGGILARRQRDRDRGPRLVGKVESRRERRRWRGGADRFVKRRANPPASGARRAGRGP